MKVIIKDKPTPPQPVLELELVRCASSIALMANGKTILMISASDGTIFPPHGSSTDALARFNKRLRDAAMVKP